MEPINQSITSLTTQADQPLIGIPVEEQGQVIIRYFTSDQDALRTVSADAIRKAHALAGAWSDLNWEEMVRELDRIRHSSTPTPPIDLEL